MNLLGISGSLRAASTNTALLRALAREMPPGATLDVYGGLADLPLFNPDKEGEGTPPAVRHLISSIDRAAGVVISCPEYAHGIPGGLKNALDWLVSGPSAVGKPVMLVHASHRSLFARDALREVLRTMSFAVFHGSELEVPLLGSKEEEFTAVLDDPDWRERMRICLAEFVEFIGQV